MFNTVHSLTTFHKTVAPISYWNYARKQLTDYFSAVGVYTEEHAVGAIYDIHMMQQIIQNMFQHPVLLPVQAEHVATIGKTYFKHVGRKDGIEADIEGLDWDLLDNDSETSDYPFKKRTRSEEEEEEEEEDDDLDNFCWESEEEDESEKDL